jgi:rubrerythrin
MTHCDRVLSRGPAARAARDAGNTYSFFFGPVGVFASVSFTPAWARRGPAQWSRAYQLTSEPSMRFMPNRRRFRDLSEQEVLALAISSEEDDARIYRSYAQRLRADYPDTAKLFDGMADEEDSHRRRLIELHRARFGEVIPLIRREHVAGWYARRPVWLVENLGLERIREEATIMESEAETFYLHAASRSTDAATRKLLGDLAQAEAAHRGRADALAEKHLDEEVRDDEDARAKRQFVLTWVQPGLAGSWTDRSPRSLRSLLPPSPRRTPGPRSWWASRRQSAPASPWVSPRLHPTTVNCPAADHRGSGASHPAS